jgi:Acetyltransferase (GNAT) domain
MPASGAGEVDVAVRDGQALASMLDEVIAVYRAVFCAPPYHEDDRRVAEFIERLGQEPNDRGSRPGPPPRATPVNWWGSPPPGPLPSRFPPDAPTTRSPTNSSHGGSAPGWWGALEVDELAVLPAAQGQGIDTRLLDSVCQAAPDRRAWLLTWAYAPDAVRFYRRRGWHQITNPPPNSAGVVVFLPPDHPGATAHPSPSTAP